MDSPISSMTLVRLLAEPERRRVVAALVLLPEPADAEQLADTTGLSVRQVVDAADRLISGGMVTIVDGRYELVPDVFKLAARAEVAPPKPSAHADKPSEVARVLDAAFRHGKLVQWPSKRSKRRIVLDHLAQQFEIGVRYPEREVNDRLRAFGDDVATMRRYLVDELFLDRGDGEYWRCGGTV